MTQSRPWGRDSYNCCETPMSKSGLRDVAAVISMIVEDTQESALEQLLFLHMQGEVSAIPSRPVIVCSAVRCECERRPGRTAAAYACFGSFSWLAAWLAADHIWLHLKASKTWGLFKRVGSPKASFQATPRSMHTCTEASGRMNFWAVLSWIKDDVRGHVSSHRCVTLIAPHVQATPFFFFA